MKEQWNTLGRTPHTAKYHQWTTGEQLGQKDIKYQKLLLLLRA